MSRFSGGMADKAADLDLSRAAIRPDRYDCWLSPGSDIGAALVLNRGLIVWTSGQSFFKKQKPLIF